MSDKLSPRPGSNRPLYGWEELDKRLQANLTKGKPDKRYLVIRLDDFEMSAADIEAEATKQGYVVSRPSDGFMRFD